MVYDMIWYDIYLLQLVFHPVIVFDKFYKNKKEMDVNKRRNDTKQ